MLFVRSFRRLLVALLLLAGFHVAHAQTTYYLSPTGNDSNSGLSAGSPWLTPNHPVRCGDTIVAAPGTNYSAGNFNTGHWGTVACPAGNNVAWLRCATFDACRISTSSAQGMWVDRSYWGVEGWEVSATAADPYGTCFAAQPNWQQPQNIHHIIFANNVANGCSQGGFALNPNTSSLTGVDYLAIVGNIAYNAAQGSNSCTSGISVWEPVQSDQQPGTHLYIAGNFSYSNLDPPQCGGHSPTDGEGIILDSFNGTQTSGMAPYDAQTVVTNNILVGNGAKALEVYNNSGGPHTNTIYLMQNTTWGNLTDPNQNLLGCGELFLLQTQNVAVYGGIYSTGYPTGCNGNPIYGMAVSGIDSSNSVVYSLGYGQNGANAFSWNSGSFSYDQSNLLGISPAFINAVVPPAPNCAGTANVPACMAQVVHNFIPTNSAAQRMGYHPASATPVSDPLFPAWLCGASLPPGLITMGCAAPTSPSQTSAHLEAGARTSPGK